MSMYLSSRDRWEDVALSPSISPEDFLQAVCYRYEDAARFVLDWAACDPAAATGYLAAFLARVYAEVNVHDHYMSLRVRGSSFGERRPSVSKIAFERFCDLLFENHPDFVRDVLNHPATSMDVRRFSMLADRLGSTTALTRGAEWRPRRYDFRDPEPLPGEVVEQFLERKYHDRDERQVARIRELKQEVRELEKAVSEVRWEERRRAALERDEIRSRHSRERRLLRELLGRMTLQDRLLVMTDCPAIPVKVFPVAPEEVTDEVLERLPRERLELLFQRCGERWEEPWKCLASRIEARLSSGV